MHPIRNLIRRRLIARAVERGFSREDAEATLSQMESERPILDWLINGGFEQFLELFLKLLALFSEEKAAA